MPLAVELPGIEDVVPNAIEAASQRADGSEKGVAHPDGKDGVFLSQGLARGNGGTIAAAYVAACGKLEHTGNKRRKGDGEQERGGAVAVHKAAHRHGYGYAQRHGPKVEGEVATGGDALL